MAGLLRRVGVIGDAHSEDVRLKTALELFESEQVDGVLSVGDIVDGRGDVNRTCELLREADAVVVAGNHERWMLGGLRRDLSEPTRACDVEPHHRSFIAALPREIELSTVSGRALLCHGLGPHDMAAVRPDDTGYALGTNDILWTLVGTRRYALVINGHTHERMVRRFEATVIINAGTLTKERGGAVIVDFAEQLATFYGFTGEEALASIERVCFAQLPSEARLNWPSPR